MKREINFKKEKSTLLKWSDLKKFKRNLLKKISRYLPSQTSWRTRTSWMRWRTSWRLPKTLIFPKSIKFHQIFCNMKYIQQLKYLGILLPVLLSPSSWRSLMSSQNKTVSPNTHFSLFLLIFHPHLLVVLSRHEAKTTLSFISVGSLDKTWGLDDPQFYICW